MQHSLVLQEFRKPGRRELDAFISGDIVGPLWLPFNTATEWFYQRRFCTQRAFWHLHGVGANTSATQARFLSMTLFESCPRFRIEGCDLDVAWVGDGCQVICGPDSDLIVLRSFKRAHCHTSPSISFSNVRTVCAIRSCGSLGCFLWVAKLAGVGVDTWPSSHVPDLRNEYRAVDRCWYVGLTEAMREWSVTVSVLLQAAGFGSESMIRYTYPNNL